MSQQIRVLQITDLHLKADTAALWRGHNVQHACDAILKLASEDPQWPPHLIIVTGDIVDDETPEGYRTTYQRLAEQLRHNLASAAKDTQIAYIPGNHDDPTVLQQCCQQLDIQGCGSFELPNWQIIQLDSTLPQQCDGQLGEAELTRLRKYLNNSQQTNILITLHHPLINLGSQWLDSMRVKDAAAFFDTVLDFNAHASETDRTVKAIIWGHAHQQTDTQKADILLLGTPAAGPVQFMVGSDDFAIDNTLAPGLRWLTLHPNGNINTRVERLTKN